MLKRVVSGSFRQAETARNPVLSLQIAISGLRGRLHGMQEVGGSSPPGSTGTEPLLARGFCRCGVGAGSAGIGGVFRHVRGSALQPVADVDAVAPHHGADDPLSPQAIAVFASRPGSTCDLHAARMNCMSTIQVRNVPEDLHHQLKARAAGQGRSLSDYVLDELRVAANRPTMGEGSPPSTRCRHPSARPRRQPRSSPTSGAAPVTRLVADASAIVDLLAGAPNAPAITRVLAPFPEIDVPDTPRRSDLRPPRHAASRRHRRRPAERALQLLPELRVARHPVEPLARSIWSMRDTLTAYDAAYLAVAQNINAQLLTTDRGLAAAARQDQRLIEITAP